MGELYLIKGELDLASEYLENGLALYKQSGQNITDLTGFLNSLFHLALRKNDLNQAKSRLQAIKRINERSDNRLINAFYVLDKALLLKTSLRIRNLAKSEELLKHLVEEQHGHSVIYYKALLNLCDLLLIEIRHMGNQEVIDELQSYINLLLNFSEKNRAYSLMTETYLLQSKLALLVFDIKKSRRFLTQALQIAERYDLTQIATKIIWEQDELRKKTSFLKKLKENNAPISERMRLIGLDKQLEGMISDRAKLTTLTTEKNVTIHKDTKICLVCRGEVRGFTFICQCDSIYCENCARALTQLENACWVCNAPIDDFKSKKSYPIEKEESLDFSTKKQKSLENEKKKPIKKSS